MNQDQLKASDAVAERESSEYVAPAIESIVTPQELEREVHYDGGAPSVIK